jgi:pyrroloquinoline quinone biosynthesis protein D
MGVGAVIHTLAGRYIESPRELIARDVTDMLQDLADKGCLTRVEPH